MRVRTYLVGTVLLLTVMGCGSRVTSQAGGALAVVLKGAGSFNPHAEHGRIEQYEVEISGEDMVSPVIAVFPGDAIEGVIEGVPVGEKRVVRVTAINPNASIIRAGETPDVTIEGGENLVEVALESVPIFTNVREGAWVENTRLVFQLFADPTHRVRVEERLGEASVSLVDASLGRSDIALDAITGLGRCAPVVMSPGKHRFAVVDEVTGRETELSVSLTDGTLLRPAPLVAASSLEGVVTW